MKNGEERFHGVALTNHAEVRGLGRLGQKLRGECESQTDNAPEDFHVN